MSIDLYNYFDSPNKSLDGNDNKLVVGGTSVINGIEYTAEELAESLLGGLSALSEAQLIEKTLDNTIIVKSIDDLANINPDKTYRLDVDINVGTDEIELDENGIVLYSDDPDKRKIFSTEPNHTMFKKKASAAFVGDIRMRLLSLRSSGLNSKLFNIIGNYDPNTAGTGKSFEFLDVNFGGFAPSDYTTELGILENIRQLFFSGCGVYNVSEGFLLNGDFNGCVVDNSNFIVTGQNLGTFLRNGTDTLFQGSIRSNANFNNVNSDAEFTDISGSNLLKDGGFSLNNFRTTASNPLPNLPRSDVKVRFRDCNGIQNTHVGGKWRVTSTATTVLDANVLSKISGTTTYSDLQHFGNGGGNNTLTYISEEVREFKVRVEATIDGGANDELEVFIRQWDDSASTYINIDSRPRVVANVLGGLDVAYFNFEDTLTLDKNDRVEAWIRNNTDGTDIIALLDTTLTVEER